MLDKSSSLLVFVSVGLVAVPPVELESPETEWAREDVLEAHRGLALRSAS